MRVALFLALAVGLQAQVPIWPPSFNTPGLVFMSPSGPSVLIEPVILGTGVKAPVKGPFGWFLTSTNIPPAVASGWIPLVLATTQPTDGTERWCYSNLPNLDVTTEGVQIQRTISPAAVKEVLQVTSIPPLAVAAGSYQYETFTVVQPGPTLDGSGNEIRVAPWWSRSDSLCPGANPAIILVALPTTTPGTTYKRTTVLVLANW